MHDVFAQIVLPAGDEDLGSRDGIGAVGQRLRLGADEAEVRAAVGLGQAHRSEPRAADELCEVDALLVGGAVLVKAFVGAVREPRVHSPCLVCRVQHFI